MNKKELWRKFMSSGSVSDYLEYKKARDRELVRDIFDSEVSPELAEEFINNFDSDFPAMDRKKTNMIYDGEYSDDDDKD